MMVEKQDMEAYKREECLDITIPLAGKQGDPGRQGQTSQIRHAFPLQVIPLSRAETTRLDASRA